MISFSQRLSDRIQTTRSWLCVGLDIASEALGNTDLSLQAVKDHCLKVIAATSDLACAYKPNLAFFERWGSEGFRWLEEVLTQVGSDVITIGDGKRGDIGNTARQYAKALFDYFNFDAITVNPYMGKEAIIPFLEKPDKGVFVLARTSNPSAADLQNHLRQDVPVYLSVVEMCQELNELKNVGIVAGATAPEELRQIRKAAPELPLLIPGVGAQGGDMAASLKIGNDGGPALINVSRAIAFSGDLSEKAIRRAALEYRDEMRRIMDA